MGGLPGPPDPRSKNLKTLLFRLALTMGTEIDPGSPPHRYGGRGEFKLQVADVHYFVGSENLRRLYVGI